MSASSIIFILFLLFTFTTCNKNQEGQTSEYLNPEYWKNQALTEILPPWSKHVIDSANNSFFSNLDPDWQPDHDTLRFPSMIARHLFSYSVAYLMSGGDEQIAMAHRLKTYLMEYAWDKQHGGWFDALHPNGKPAQVSKSTFVQVYVITGLAMYYVVTHDVEVLEYINRSNALLEEKVWDPDSGGYFDAVDQDWSLRTEVKSVSSQLAPVSGYLLYLYMATRNRDYLEQAERIMDVVMVNMVDSSSGWVLESFDGSWNYLPGNQDENEINVGHNIEVAWSLFRLYMVNNRQDYLEKGKKLADSTQLYGFNQATGFWYGGVDKANPKQHTAYSHWWIQAYGNMLNLSMAKLYPNSEYLSRFCKGAAFWDTVFMDRMQGDTHLTVRENGDVITAQKANQFKASYHNMEHGLLNYLYLRVWLFPQPLTLHFKISSSGEGEVLNPMPIENLNCKLKDVVVDGNPYHNGHISGDSVTLPALKDAALKVTIY